MASPLLLTVSIPFLGKSHKGASAYVLERLGLPAAEVAYIDDVPAYVSTAADLGIQAILHRDEATTRRALAAALAAGG